MLHKLPMGSHDATFPSVKPVQSDVTVFYQIFISYVDHLFILVYHMTLLLFSGCINNVMTPRYDDVRYNDENFHWNKQTLKAI